MHDMLEMYQVGLPQSIRIRHLFSQLNFSLLSKNNPVNLGEHAERILFCHIPIGGHKSQVAQSAVQYAHQLMVPFKARTAKISKNLPEV
jgi:hypothetical protein